MKRLLLLLYIGLLTPGVSDREKVQAADSRITYVGRTLVQEGTVSFDWSAVYARISFTGGYLALEAGDSGKDYFNLWIDKEPSAEPDRVIVLDRDTTVVLFQQREKRPRPHRIVLQKRTEGEQGRATFRALEVEGELLQAEPLRERLIEFIGDSYTCGYGTDSPSRDAPFRPEEENPAKTYADILCRYFGADGCHLSHSGQGIDRNYDEAGRGCHMPDRYLRTFDLAESPVWEASGPKPSLTVIYLCTNDFSTERQPSLSAFCAQYQRLLGQVKANYGEDHPILCVAPLHGEEHHRYVREAVSRCGLSRVYYAGIPAQANNTDTDLGASWHPNYSGQRKQAYVLAPVISTLTGWPMENKPLL